jgi:hypothetical protein
MNKIPLFAIACLACLSGTSLYAAGGWYLPDPGCASYTAWQIQSNVLSDSVGIRNVAYPEGGATYWGTIITQPTSGDVVFQGRFPLSRYMALQVYDTNRNLLGFINDQDIVPDRGTNNPFVSGSDQGTYTVRVVFGKKPIHVPRNTIYTNGVAQVLLLYRIYASNNPDDLTAGTFDPVLPNILVNGGVLSTCPPRPIITPETLTVWGRLGETDYIGVVPAPGAVEPVSLSPPRWVATVPGDKTGFYPSGANAYMTTRISRRYLAPPFSNDMVVMTMRAPSFPNTQAGEAPYLADTSRQTRFWSVCEYDPVSTGVNRCLPDYLANVESGFVTIVFSDPSKQPSAATLAQWGAQWLPWGALLSSDDVYDVALNKVGNDQSVYYYGVIMYRQTLSNPTWTQSIANVVANNAGQDMKTAMGDYWPQIGYCNASVFASVGPACIQQ